MKKDAQTKKKPLIAVVLQRGVRRLKCNFESHGWEEDKTPTNGVLWRFCKHCGCRQRGLEAIVWRNF